MTAVCARPSCRQPFDPDHLESNACRFHPGAPLFREGLKSWTCCSDVNKPVTEFDDFLALAPCATGTHTLDAPSDAVAQSSTVENATAALAKADLAAEEASAASNAVPTKQASVIPPRPSFDAAAAPAVTTSVLIDDPPDATPGPGTACKRSGCGQTFRDGMERSADECVHHPSTPIFHEGSKGWACCKKRVLGFSEFLAIPGCARGRHLFVGAPETEQTSVVTPPPRTDHYQTPSSVIASIFVKAVDATASSITFTHWELQYDLVSSKTGRSRHSVALYGPIEPQSSSYRVMGTKVEVTLIKADGRSWPTLEAQDPSKGTRGQQITFGVTGRTGTVGGKEAFIAPDSQHR